MVCLGSRSALLSRRVSADHHGACDTVGLDFSPIEKIMPRNKDPLALKKPPRPGHGGKREGSGRPAAKATKRSKEIADEIAEGKRKFKEVHGEELPEDATPLDVMMMAMRAAYKQGGSIAAAPYAEKCAPYVHARLANIQATGANNGPIVLAFAWLAETGSDTD